MREDKWDGTFEYGFGSECKGLADVVVFPVRIGVGYLFVQHSICNHTFCHKLTICNKMALVGEKTQVKFNQRFAYTTLNVHPPTCYEALQCGLESP